ncbi:MAG: YitT family protein [Solirubrobacterales bacterium]
MTKAFTDFFRHTLVLTSGSFLCAVAVNGILVPQGFLAKGLTGAALIVHYCHPILPVGVLYLLMNIPVFVLGWRLVGVRFVLYSLWGMVIYSATLSLISLRIEVGDKMLSAVVAGALSGTGMAMILRSYGSTGGAEILCVVLRKVFSIPLGVGSLMLNGVILAAGIVLFPLEAVLYSLVYVAVSARATDVVFHGLAKRQAAIIISDRWGEIARELTTVHRLGITRIDGWGGYQGTGKTILYSVISRKNMSLLKRVVLTKDPGAFVAIMTAEDVTGVEVGNQPHW